MQAEAELGGESAFYICMGDDRTDEDMFRVLDDQGVSIKVGNETSQAQFRLHRQAEVDDFLRELDKFRRNDA
jgi:trehalose 6-phosphate synthase/phosphatase